MSTTRYARVAVNMIRQVQSPLERLNLPYPVVTHIRYM
jgi:hypothetical protein